MKSDTRNQYTNIMVLDFQDIIVSIESLREYYLNSIDNIQKMKLNIEKDYAIGLFVGNGIKKALSAEDREDTKKLLDELNNETLPNGSRVSEYVIVEYEEDEDEMAISYSIKKNSAIKTKYVDPRNARRAYDKVDQYENILISSTLSNVIIVFEQYLAKVYKSLILINPRKYFQNQKVEIADIFNKNVRDIVIECVNNEVESNMFDSLKTLELISEKENININRYINIMDEFEEIYYRRNLYIHNNGIVNNIYFCNVKEKYKKNKNIGEKLISDDIYLRNAINMLYKVIGTLFYEIQVAYNPKNEKWNKALSDMAFDLLCEKNYDVAEHLYFILSSCKQLCFRDKAMFRINYINALKQQGKDILVKKELEGLDVSIATDDYKIAKLCLEDRNEEVYKALNTNYPKVYSAELVRDWPIFINFRETDYYQKFIEEHSADADTIVVKFTEDGNEIQEN